MGIGLRIVGIFYSTEVELEGGSGTVKDVLEAAQNQITAGTNFNYGFTSFNGKESPNMFRAFYEAPIVSTASGIEYPAGEYILSEDLNARPAYTVWQYYIISEDGIVLNRGKGFIPYDDEKQAVVEDGQSVVWRLLSVLAQPTGLTPRLSSSVSV